MGAPRVNGLTSSTWALSQPMALLLTLCPYVAGEAWMDSPGSHVKRSTGLPAAILALLLSGAESIAACITTQNCWRLALTSLAGLFAVFLYRYWKNRDTPPVMRGWPVIGVGLAFQKDPLKTLQEGFAKYGSSPSRCFGLQLASYTHYVITQKKDLEFIKADGPYEIKFNLHQFMQSINFAIITRKDNFDLDLHIKLIRTNFGDPKILKAFGSVIEAASAEFLQRKPLATENAPGRYEAGIINWMNEYIAFVVSRCVVGPEGYDNEDLIRTFLKFNDDAVAAMGLSSLLPSFLQFLASFNIKRDLATVRKVILPIITKRRQRTTSGNDGPVFLDFILTAVDDNERAADLVAIVVWGGLVNLQATFSATLLDIIDDPTGQSRLTPSLRDASIATLDTFSPGAPSPWALLRSAMFESIRLSGPITGSARIVTQEVHLPSQPAFRIPKGQVVTLSAYATHRDPASWGDDAAVYRPDRFLKTAPPIGEPEFSIWGLQGPHTCPGRWFAQAMIQIMTKKVLEAYVFGPIKRIPEEQKYVYTPGTVVRAPLSVVVTAA